MDVESFITQVAICTRENLLMIWLRALVSIDMQMAVNMSDIGTKTNNMVLEKRNGTI
jgi:hypothetical protein